VVSIDYGKIHFRGVSLLVNVFDFKTLEEWEDAMRLMEVIVDCFSG
jgi:hypothetical protein